MIEKYKVSFIIAAFNEELFIRDCIESCLNQTYSNIEVCVTDDGSNDNTWSILEDLALNPRVKISKFNRNKGKVAAFNRSFEMATGDYIAVIGGDDVNLPNRITAQMQHIKKSQSDLVWGGFEIVDEVLNHISVSSIKTPVTVSTKSLLEKNMVTGGTILMNSDLAIKVFPLPEKLKFEDWWIGYKATSLGKISYLDDVLIKYRQHANNAAGGSDKNTLDQVQGNFKRHLDFYSEVKMDVRELYSGYQQKELLRVIDGAVVYRRICLNSSLLERISLLLRNGYSLLSLGFMSIIKVTVITIVGMPLFIRLKSMIRKIKR